MDRHDLLRDETAVTDNLGLDCVHYLTSEVAPMLGAALALVG